ncbi:MAG TPA: heparin lyase I family protein [Solirubrobacterales bacterium]|nr:heparin lyase I family protein [Solirubrobacterales bacterium]
MPFSARIAALLAASALLVSLCAGPATAVAKPAPQGASKAKASKQSKKQRRHHRKARARRQAGQGKRGVSDNISLSSVSSKARAVAKPKATPSVAGLLFNGARISDFDLIQAAPGAITEVPDPAGSGETNLQMTVNDRDVAPITPTENPRAQLLSPPIIDNGEEFWLSTKFFIPTNFPTSSHGWMSLVSIYGAPFGGSSPWQIEVVDGRLQWMRNGTYNWDVPWQMPLIKGSWVTVLLHERFASDGFVEMWINGQQVSFFGRETRLAMQTMDRSNNGDSNSAKIMQYREAGMFETGTLYFGALKIGTTRESVSG